MKKPRILIVDADPKAEQTYSKLLSALGGVELSATSQFDQAAEFLKSSSFDLIILRLSNRPAELAGFERLRASEASTPIVVVADPPSVESATASLRLGAGEYLSRAALDNELAAACERLLGQRRRGDEYEVLRRQVERPYTFDDIIGACPAMRKVFQTIEQVADSDVDVLVHGETGTGKELIARSIHRRSRRSAGPFVPVDCGAIPDSLLESEFFGHEKGSFTGAESRRIGLLEFADHGTFFLDELGELPAILQAKLLRTLQERKIRRVGGRRRSPSTCESSRLRLAIWKK